MLNHFCLFNSVSIRETHLLHFATINYISSYCIGIVLGYVILHKIKVQKVTEPAGDFFILFFANPRGFISTCFSPLTALLLFYSFTLSLFHSFTLPKYFSPSNRIRKQWYLLCFSIWPTFNLPRELNHGLCLFIPFPLAFCLLSG